MAPRIGANVAGRAVVIQLDPAGVSYCRRVTTGSWAGYLPQIDTFRRLWSDDAVVILSGQAGIG